MILLILRALDAQPPFRAPRLTARSAPQSISASLDMVPFRYSRPPCCGHPATFTGRHLIVIAQCSSGATSNEPPLGPAGGSQHRLPLVAAARVDQRLFRDRGRRLWERPAINPS